MSDTGIHIGNTDSEGTVEAIGTVFVDVIAACEKHHMDQATTQHIITQLASKMGVHNVTVSGCNISQ